MLGTWERKYTCLSDPPVTGTPFSIQVDEAKCNGCGFCVKQCPCQSIELVAKKPRFSGLPYFGKVCLACHNCEAICPNGALTFPHYYRVDKGRWTSDFRFPDKPGDGLPNPLMLGKPAPFSEIESKLTPTEKVIYTRRSTRLFKSKPVPKELIHRVLEAGRFAPSAGNCQAWKFVVVTNQTLLNDLSRSAVRFLGLMTKIYQGRNIVQKSIKNIMAIVTADKIDQRPMVAIQGSLTPKSGEKPTQLFFHAPCVIFLMPHKLHISVPELDMGICGQNMVLAAHSLGLGTCYNSFVSNALNLDPITRLRFGSKLGLKWPYTHISTSIALGYPTTPVDKAVEREFPQVNWVQ